MIRRTAVILYLPRQTNTCSKVATKSLEITEKIYLFKQTTTGFVKNTFFAEHLRVTASVICMRVAPICNLNLYLQFVSINFTFSLLRVFTLAHALMSLNFFVDLQFGRVILSYALQDRFQRQMRTKHNIQKTQIHSFYNKLLGELTAIRQLFLNFSIQSEQCCNACET